MTNQPYQPHAGALWASHSEDSVTVTPELNLKGSGFTPRFPVLIDLYSTPVRLATPIADAGGSFSVSLSVPPGTPPGNHEIRVSGTDADGTDVTMNIPIVVQTASTLPATGNGSVLLAAIGVLLVLCGSFLRGLATNRRRPHPS